MHIKTKDGHTIYFETKDDLIMVLHALREADGTSGAPMIGKPDAEGEVRDAGGGTLLGPDEEQKRTERRKMTHALREILKGESRELLIELARAEPYDKVSDTVLREAIHVETNRELAGAFNRTTRVLKAYGFDRNNLVRHDRVRKADGSSEHLYRLRQLPHAIIRDLEPVETAPFMVGGRAGRTQVQ